ncbi:MAG: flagellar hook-length control protein FliK [Polyangiaceae bacterium]
MSDISTGLKGGLAPHAHERADDEKTTLDQAQRWASLLGAQLAATAVKTLTPAGSDTTTAWHSGAGDLTPSNALQGSSTGAVGGATVGEGGTADPSENRMIVRVDGGDLGEVALVVDRKDGAIRVTISAADAGAEAALGLERAGLMAALQSHGITVDSVNVVRANNFGTVLAPTRSNAAPRTREATEAESKDDEHARRRLARKLNLIG